MGGYLTDRKLMNITEPGDYTDGPDAKGLKARARRLSNDDLSIRWVQRVYIKDPDAKDPDTAKTIRSKDVGLGVYPKVSLTEARRIADANQALGDQGIDPRSKKVDKARIPTFDEMALEVFDADCERHASGQLRASTLRRKRSNLNRHIMPAFPGRPIDKIEMGDIENMMAPIYKTKRPTFNRVWSFTKAMFDLAIVRTPLEFNPVNNSVLTALKALGRNSHQEDHYESVPYPLSRRLWVSSTKKRQNPDLSRPSWVCSSPF